MSEVTLHGQPVKVGDKVWHILYGYGTVNKTEGVLYTINVSYDKCGEWSSLSYLFWQPISPEAIEAAKVKPKEPEYEYQWVFFNVMKHRFETTDYFSSGITPNVVKPESLIRIEESKREVKP
jgi:hypothetical protein